MIGYRFLTPAEIEMTEASAFYEAATSGLGAEFLDEVQRVIDIIREHPELGRSIDQGFRVASPFSIQPNLFPRSGRGSDCRGRSSAPACQAIAIETSNGPLDGRLITICHTDCQLPTKL
jgi:hypothetical protein